MRKLKKNKKRTTHKQLNIGRNQPATLSTMPHFVVTRVHKELGMPYGMDIRRDALVVDMNASGRSHMVLYLMSNDAPSEVEFVLGGDEKVEQGVTFCCEKTASPSSTDETWTKATTPGFGAAPVTTHGATLIDMLPKELRGFRPEEVWSLGNSMGLTENQDWTPVWDAIHSGQPLDTSSWGENELEDFPVVL